VRHTAAVQPDEPEKPSLRKQRDDEEEEERRRKRAERREDIADGAAEGIADAATSPRGRSRGSGCDCDGCDVCDFLLFVRLSSVLLGVAVVLPETGGRAMARALLRAYRRWFTRFTPACPSTPSCSAYAVSAVESLGARRGLVAAAIRVRSCGTGAAGVTADPSSRPTTRST
jgi:putative component of membrane protein insertase Oxa1/YidC/SpoIIIJ protein YidD